MTYLRHSVPNGQSTADQKQIWRPNKRREVIKKKREIRKQGEITRQLKLEEQTDENFLFFPFQYFLSFVKEHVDITHQSIPAASCLIPPPRVTTGHSVLGVGLWLLQRFPGLIPGAPQGIKSQPRSQGLSSPHPKGSEGRKRVFLPSFFPRSLCGEEIKDPGNEVLFS